MKLLFYILRKSQGIIKKTLLHFILRIIMNPLEKSIVNWIESQGCIVKSTEFITSSNTFYVQVEREQRLEGFVATYTSGNDVFFPSRFITALCEAYHQKRVNNLENTQVIVLLDDVGEPSIKATETQIEKINNTKVILTYKANDSLEVIRKFDYTES